jgi:hypothetical protein
MPVAVERKISGVKEKKNQDYKSIVTSSRELPNNGTSLLFHTISWFACEL